MCYIIYCETKENMILTSTRYIVKSTRNPLYPYIYEIAHIIATWHSPTWSCISYYYYSAFYSNTSIHTYSIIYLCIPWSKIIHPCNAYIHMILITFGGSMRVAVLKFRDFGCYVCVLLNVNFQQMHIQSPNFQHMLPSQTAGFWLGFIPEGQIEMPECQHTIFKPY
jgi:hypothetical protein